LVIELADTMTDTPSTVSDDLYARLRDVLSEEQLMQLGAQIAFENYRARWNRIFNVESDNLYTPQQNKSQEPPSA
jgi:alkylhydroperoxidase family enzyme